MVYSRPGGHHGSSHGFRFTGSGQGSAAGNAAAVVGTNLLTEGNFLSGRGRYIIHTLIHTGARIKQRRVFPYKYIHT